MAEARFELIYQQMKERIEGGKYDFQDLLPSEHRLTEMYHCSRGTIRKVLYHLGQEGYVQSIHGKGVQVLYRMEDKAELPSRDPARIRQVLMGEDPNWTKRLLRFDERLAGRNLTRYHFSEECRVYCLVNVYYRRQVPVFMDYTYIRKDAVPGLTREIARDSVMKYYESCGNRIVTSKREFRLDVATKQDEAWLDLGDYHCVGVINSHSFNKEGEVFLLAHSRFSPAYIRLYSNIQW